MSIHDDYIARCVIFIFCVLPLAIECTQEYRTLYSKRIPYGYVDGKLCNRDCNGKNLNCFFNFELETFLTMNKACFDCPKVLSDCWRLDCVLGGGIKRTVSVINRQLPGPSIEVCQGDKVMVLLQNNLLDGAATSIHWHGQHMKRNQYMDGVAWVTQCPVLHNNNFTYEFYADNAGTYWWHSHSVLQHGDGLFGAFIVREPPSKIPHYDLYDFDLSSHVLQVCDWNNQSRLDVFENYALGSSLLGPTGILVNGLGYQASTGLRGTPSANFTIKSGYRYRFRFINSGFGDCPIEMSIDGHKMLIIAMDGHYVKPFEVDSFVSTTGERFDFVLNANQPISTYYIRIKGYLTCKYMDIFTVATLIYEGTTVSSPEEPFPDYETAAKVGGVILNPISVQNATDYTKVYGIDEVRAVEPLPNELKSTKIDRYYITIGMGTVENPIYNKDGYYGFDQVRDPNQKIYNPQLNRITNMFMDAPYLPYRFQLDRKQFCNEKTMKDRDCERNFCKCPHVIEISMNSIVEFVFIDLFRQDMIKALHPIHLHGYSFSVLGWGEIGRNLTKQEVIQMDKEGKLKRNLVDPPLKDTVTVPKGGYTIVRFKADNVGYWLLHCHIGYHTGEGMDLTLKVGSNFLMPWTPMNFPTCGNFKK